MRVDVLLAMHSTPTANGCIEWTGRINHNGYGQIYHAGKEWRAHRLAALAAGLPVRSGAVVLHSCDNRRCINPAHLTVGTSLDNNRDMLRKGRSRHFVGSETRNAKLNETDVAAIRASDGPLRLIGERFGVTKATVSRIRAGKLWAHVPCE